jgi:hypothetical protein
MYPGLEKRRYEWKVLLKSMNNSDFLKYNCNEKNNEKKTKTP